MDSAIHRSPGGHAADAGSSGAASRRTEAVRPGRRRRRYAGSGDAGMGCRTGVLACGAGAVRPTRTDAAAAFTSARRGAGVVDVLEGDSLLGQTLSGLGMAQLRVLVRPCTELALHATDHTALDFRRTATVHKQFGPKMALNVDRFSRFFHCQNQEEIVITLSLKIPPHLKCVATLPCVL